jgi:subfamily B ATP-binding cassette protein MsbA
MRDPGAAPLPNGDRPAPAPRESIRLDNVRYRYLRGDRDAVSGLTLDIPVGKTTALVGHSGSGKSTVLSLVCRHFDPDEGAVLVDGVSLKEFDLRSWRARIATVPQDVFLFDDTIRANIAFGKTDATEAEVAEARGHAGAEFIEQLPQGIDTRLGDRGSLFSGGQRQRIALARAIIADPDLLILDEATNALDNLAARLVQDAIQRASAGRTVLVVAHRLAPVRNADHVIVLDKGRVVEAGAPDALIRAGGAFSRLIAAEDVAA